MSDDFCFDESNILNGTLRINDEDLDEEYEQHLRTQQQAAVAEAMQEAMDGFSSFDDSSCEDEDTSSEEDVPQTCNSVTPPESFQPGLRMIPSSTHSSSPTIKTQVRSHSIPEGLNRSELFTQHHGALTNGENRLLLAEAHSLSASADSLVKMGTQHDRLRSPSGFYVADPSEDHRYLNNIIDSPDQRQNYVKVQAGFHHQTEDYNHNCKSQGDSWNVGSENMDWERQSFANNFGISSTSDSGTSGQVYQQFQTAYSNNFLPDQNGCHTIPVMTVRNTNDINSDDEWMMHIKTPVKAYTQPHHPNHQHPHHQFRHHHDQLSHQAADNSQDSKLKSNLLVQSASAHSSTSLPSTKLVPPSTKLVPPSTKLVPASTKAPQMSAPPPSTQDGTSASRDVRPVQPVSRNAEVHDGGDGQFGHYKVHYEKPKLCKLDEEQFYLDNENVEFLHIDGSDDHRSSQQLEILYRARGREIEELTRTMEEKDEEKSKEMRNLKHRLAIASGDSEAVNQTLRQYQQLLQQSKADNSEACGKIRALETQVSSFRDTKEELIQKLQMAESTIENLTHHIEELQESESLSRARNEHEAMTAGLTSRHERELLVVRENLDFFKTSLEAKQEELVAVKKLLAETAQELELTQVSKAETVNRLTRSLEESQRRCQAILEQSSSPEISMMKVHLQQAVASKRVSEDLCETFQREIKELKEQLNMFESASQLGVFTASSSSASIPSHDDSMTDLGIRKTLNFDSPQSVPRQETASEKLIASLKSELERCLCSNKQKRSEVMDKVEEVKAVKEELETAQSRVASLEKTCADQKVRLQELDSLKQPGGGGAGAVEARLQREIEDLKRDRIALLADIEDYKKRLQEVGDSEAKLAEINAELSHQIAQMVNDFDLDKQSALQSCQRTMEAVNRQSFDKLRQDIEERFQSEKTMLMEDSKRKLDNLNQQLRTSQAELDHVKSLYVTTCEEHSQREVELKENYKTQLEEELRKITDKLQKEKNEWEHFMRDQIEKERDQIKDSLRQTIEAEFKEQAQKTMEIMVAEARLACLEEQRLVRQTMIDEALTDAKKLWQMEHEKDSQHWIEERNVYESKLASKNNKISEYKQKLDLVVGEKERFQKLAEDLELDRQTNVSFLEKRHEEVLKDIMMKYDGQLQEVEKKLTEMYQQFAKVPDNRLGSVTDTSESFHDNKLDSVTDTSESFQVSDLFWKLNLIEKIMNEKEARLQELEQLQGQKTALLMGVSKNGSNLNNLNGSFIDSEGYHGDLSEASAEKLKENIENLESELHTMKQKHNMEVNELKQLHQKEFENASKLREDKFQSEMHYFLKEKEDQYKFRMETAVKQCEDQAELQQEQVLKKADEKCKCVMHETVCEFENKIAELQKIINEYEERFKTDTKQSAEDTLSLRDKMRREISVLEEKYITEKSILEKKMKQIEEEKDGEIVNLCLLQAEEVKKLKEQFDSNLASLKVEHQNIIKQLEQELSLQKSEVDKRTQLIQSLKKENESNQLVIKELKKENESNQLVIKELKKENESNKLIVEELRKENEQMKGQLSNTLNLAEQIKQQRTKWFLEAQEYINKEIIQGVEDEIKKEEGKVRDQIEKVKEEERKLKEKLEKIKEEEKKIRDKLEKLDEEERKVREKQEKIKEEERKINETWEKIREDLEKIREKQEKLKEDDVQMKEKLKKITEDEDTIRKKLEKINEEEEKMKKEKENIKEWEKNKERFERDKKEELRKIIQLELENLKKKFIVELNARVEAMKSQLEQQKMVLQEEERSKFLTEKEQIIKTLRSDMERSLQEAKKRIEMKVEQVKENQLREMRTEMQAEMRKRIQSVREEWDQEREDQASIDGVEVNRLRDCVRAETDARIKACQERDKAVNHLKYQELLFQEKEQSLMSALKKCQQQRDATSNRQKAATEQAGTSDRKYKMNPTKMKAENNQIPHPGPRIMATQESQHQDLDRTRAEHTDLLTQIQGALPRVFAPVVGREVIDIFNVRAKMNIRTALSQQVPEKMITALERSLDLLSEHVKSAAAKGPNSDSASSRPGSGTYDSLGEQPTDDNDVVVFGSKQTNCQMCRDAYINNQHLHQHRHSHYGQNKHKEEQKWHPQLDKVDLFDSDWYQPSASGSGSSSPVSQTHAKTHLKPAAVSHQMAASNVHKFLQNEITKARTTPTKLEAADENDDEFSSLPSARPERKSAETTVRLENWTQTGEMQWKSPRERHVSHLYDADGFIRPGLEMETKVGQQGDHFNFLTDRGEHANVVKHGQHCYNLAHVPSDISSEHSCSSDDASTSFMTLQSDIDPIVARSHFNSLKFSKSNNAAFMHRDGHAEKRVVREYSQQTQQSEYDPDIDFGLQVPAGHMRSEHACVQNVSTGYSRRCLTPPPSSVLTKWKMTDDMRARSEEDDSGIQWKMTDDMRARSEEDDSGIQCKHIGGPLISGFPKDDAITERNLEPRQSSRSKVRSHSSQPASSRLKTNSRSRSAERNDLDLVVKSTEFLTETSRINQNTQTNLWRYKSLEELIPSLNQQNLEINYVKFDENSWKERQTMCVVDGQAPVVAMTSNFWQQHCGNDTVVPNGHHDHAKQPGYSQFGSETKHKKGKDKYVSPIFNQNSSPTRQKISTKTKKQLSGNKMNVDFKAANQIKWDMHAQPCVKRRPTRMRDVAGLRRSLEEEQLSQYYQLSSPIEDARKSKMTRALSEQSLHTLHFEKDYSQGQDPDPESHIDDLVSTYTSSHFDLRPFLYDEHF